MDSKLDEIIERLKRIEEKLNTKPTSIHDLNPDDMLRFLPPDLKEQVKPMASDILNRMKANMPKEHSDG